MQGEEQVQTVQFYKIQLMQKQREISDFQSKLKKIEFKHNRDIKEAKSAEERAKALLKQQKNKADKISKQANENQQQNKLLQLRLNQLKQEKEKEILEVRAQYNSIKEQVRSYQRILPTHTFLTEIARSIEELPTYEDIFLNFKEKTQQYNDLTNKFQAFKAKNQEIIHTFQQNQEMLKIKKLQAQRNLKDVLPKIVQYEHQISDFKISNEQYLTTINDLRTQIQIQRSKGSNLEDTLRQYEAQVQQMRQVFTNQLHNKEEQVRLSYQQEMQRYEQQIKALSSRMEIKDNMYVSQINIMEEQMNFTQNKYHSEKEKYEELINQCKEEVQTSKSQFQKAKFEIERLQSKNQETIKNLIQVANQNEQLQQKLKGSQKKILQTAQIHIKQTKLFEQNNQNKLEEYSSKFQHLSQQYKKLKQTYSQILQQKQAIKYENQQYRQKVATLQSKSQVMNNLDIPNGNFQYEEGFRRKSIEYDKYEEEIIFMQIHQKQELYRQKEKTNELIKKTQDIQTEKGTIKNQFESAKAQMQSTKAQIQSIKEELYSRNKQNEKLQLALQEANKKLDFSTNQLIEVKKVNVVQCQKLKGVTQQNQKLTNQVQEHKDKISILNKSLSENQLLIAAINTKQNLYKAKLQSLEEQKKIILQEDKKNKELIKIQKEEIKTIKQQQSVLIQKNSKQIKELNTQIESIKQQRQILKSQYASKQKSLNYQIAILKNIKELQEKHRNQITDLNQDLSKAEQEKNALSKKYTELVKEYELSKKQIQKLELQNLQKDRQNEMISQSLNRERRQRTLRTVPSLQSLQGQQAQQQNFNDIYLTITRKQGEINILQREISDLKEQIQSLKISQANKLQALQVEQNQYIQTIIQMKMKCAQSQMRASEKEYLYNQLKRKINANGKI